MLINRDHKSWALSSAAITLAGGLSYLLYVSGRPNGPSGGSWVGIFYGIIGTTFMTVAALLGGRKKIRILRVGSAQVWMKLHIWLSLLAVPFILFHAGFRLGGPLTFVLMMLFLVVTVSGIIGLAMQQLLPSLMTKRVPLETLHSQVGFVSDGILTKAYEIVAATAGAFPEAKEEQALLKAEAELRTARPSHWKLRGTERLPPAESLGPEATLLRDVYLVHIRPYLRRDVTASSRGRGIKHEPPAVVSLLSDAPADWGDCVEQLAALCEESRQLETQMRLHRWLHGWLFVHVPVAFALMVLAALHIGYALAFKMGD